MNKQEVTLLDKSEFPLYISDTKGTRILMVAFLFSFYCEAHRGDATDFCTACPFRNVFAVPILWGTWG